MRKSTRLSQVKNTNPNSNRVSKASTQSKSNLQRSASQIYPSSATISQLGSNPNMGSANTLVSTLNGMATIR